MGFNLFDPFNVVEEGVKETRKTLSALTGGGSQPSAQIDSQADDLEIEAEAKKRARELAFGSLTQTSSTGAGAPTTKRASVLGV